jgi:hypothetical protein
VSKFLDEGDEITFSEPIMAQKGVKMKIQFAERAEWESKTAGVKNGVKFDACKVTLLIDDKSVKTEHENAKARLTIEDQFNIVGFPYEDKNTGEKKMLGRTKLYQLEEAFGFDPKFMVNGAEVAPFITKTGRKVAPKIEGVKRVVNPDFFNAYFSTAGDPIVDSWVDKTVYADIKLENSEQFGSRNSVDRYTKPPVM